MFAAAPGESESLQQRRLDIAVCSAPLLIDAAPLAVPQAWQALKKGGLNDAARR